MSRQAILAIARNDFNIFRRDPVPLLTLVALPLLVTGFAAPLYGPLGTDLGPGVSGADLAFPGMAVMFAFFFCNSIGISFFREHGWRTWDRLRSAPIASSDLLIGKCLVCWCLALMQQLLLFAFGALLFGVRIHGTILGVVVVEVALATALVTMSLMLIGMIRTVGQLSALTYLAALILGGLGGTFGPVSQLPRWTQLFSNLSPAYWAIEGLRAAIVSTDLATPLRDSAVLFGFSLVCGTIAHRTLRFSEVKLSWV